MVPSEELSMDCEWHQPFVIWLIISSSSGSVGRPWMTVAEGENLQICKDIPRVPPFKGLRFQFRRSQYVKTTSASALDRLVSPEVPIGTIVTLTEDDLSALLLQSGSEFASAVTCHMCKFEPRLANATSSKCSGASTPAGCDEPRFPIESIRQTPEIESNRWSAQHHQKCERHSTTNMI